VLTRSTYIGRDIERALVGVEHRLGHFAWARDAALAEPAREPRQRPSTGPATTYGYDEAGNLISVERPKEGETPEIKDTYAYDGNGLRASQTISGTTSYLTWDMIEGLPLILNDGTNSYIYGPGGLPVEQVSSSGTQHGLEQAIARDAGRGVSPSAILDAVRSPLSESMQADGATKYVGQDAVVVVNSEGRVVTTYARNSTGLRDQP
jgi:hypothetical protein